MTTRQLADSAADLLGCPVYYSDSGTAEEKLAVLNEWRAGIYSPVIIATSAFGVRVDYSTVRCVFHIDAPQGAISFAQETGRAGRNGQGVIYVTFLPRDWCATYNLPGGQWTLKDHRAMQEFLEDPPCRTRILSRYLDG